MPNPNYSNRDGPELSQLVARTRELIREAAQLLRGPPPDTFLGRKTQEPFTSEKSDTH